MTRAFALLGLAIVVGCTAAPSRTGRHSAIDALAANTIGPADNMIAGDVEPSWTEVSPDRVFDHGSAAARLDRPPFLKGAELGYFDDVAITRQYGARALAAMRIDDAGFVSRRS